MLRLFATTRAAALRRQAACSRPPEQEAQPTASRRSVRAQGAGRHGPAVVPVSARRPAGQDLGRRLGKEATVAEFPVSEKLAGVLMQLAPGGLRELHWHANAAEWAYVIAGQCRVTTIDPQGNSEIGGFRPGRRLVLPARLRPFDPGDRPRGLPVRAGVRQRLFLRVRHLQHQRLDRSHAARGAGEEFRRAGGDLRELPEEEVYIARGRCRRRCRRIPRPDRSRRARSRTAIGCWRKSRDTYPDGTIRLVSQREFPISSTMTGALDAHQARRLRELHWHPNADEWQYYISGRARVGVFGSHGRARTEEFERRRRRLRAAGLRSLHRERRHRTTSSC